MTPRSWTGQEAVADAGCDGFGDIGHFLRLIEQIVADSEHVHAGFQRLQAGFTRAERLPQSLHLHVVANSSVSGSHPKPDSRSSVRQAACASLSNSASVLPIVDTNTRAGDGVGRRAHEIKQR